MAAANRSGSQALRAARMARLRGAILLLLAEVTPERVNAEVLRSALERQAMEVTPRELARALDYLRHRGYLDYQVIEARDYPNLPRLVGVRITPAGMDVVEETTRDPGVDLG
ncbi:MAG: hypothetical protein HY653_03885 [Acidobacteria bacterium]|nr:hypothetical protein [Acidobacteriota bacterium]